MPLTAAPPTASRASTSRASTSTMRRLEDEDAGGTQSAAYSCWWCCGAGASVVAEVVEATQLAATTLRAPPPIDLVPGYGGAGAAERGMAPPDRGIFEIVNKTKFDNEIVAVLVSSNAADLALRKRRDHKGDLGHLREGLLPAMTVLHGSFADDIDHLEVGLFYGCLHSSVEQVRAATDVAACFRHTKVRSTGIARARPNPCSSLGRVLAADRLFVCDPTCVSGLPCALQREERAAQVQGQWKFRNSKGGRKGSPRRQ
jgi:hypothetical protein